MKFFVTGAAGYIGGSVAQALREKDHEIVGLVRSDARAAAVQERGITPLVGTLDDADLLANAARDADAVLNAAMADHRGAVEAMLPALAGSGKLFLHTSGSSVVGTEAGGERVDDVFDEDTPFTPGPGRAARVAVDERVLAAASEGVRAVVIRPSMIYGPGRGVHADSIQVPWLVGVAKKYGVARHIGRGENLWANVHIDDLVDLYLLAIERAPAGALYYAENGENSMRELCEAISRALGYDGRAESMTVDEAAAEWGEGPARHTMGSNSRVRAVRARNELGWRPHRPSILDVIARGV